MKMEKTNFEQMAEKSRELFLAHCRYSIAGKYDTDFDDEYLYISFFREQYRIGRNTGTVEAHTESNGNTGISEKVTDNGWTPAGPGETMIFYDLFCYGEDFAKASDSFVNHASLVHQLSATANPGKDMYWHYVRRFEGHVNELKSACEKMGGVPCGKGDAAYELPVFDFMNCRFEFWEADEDFPASIVLFMDANILKFMHFETTWYLSECILTRITRAAGL